MAKSREEAVAEREQAKVFAAKQSLRDGVIKRIDGAGALLAAVQDRVKQGVLGLEELSAFATVGELAAACIQMTLVHCTSEQVQVASPNEQSSILIG